MGPGIAFAAASAALAIQSAVPVQPPSLDPSGPWTVEVTEGLCLLGRKFNAAGNEFTLGLRRVAKTGNFKLLIWQPGRPTEVSKGKAQLGFDHSATVEGRYLRGPAGIVGFELTEIAVEHVEVAMLQKAATLQVRAGDFTTSFNLRGIGSAIKALDDCERKLSARGG